MAMSAAGQYESPDQPHRPAVNCSALWAVVERGESVADRRAEGEQVTPPASPPTIGFYVFPRYLMLDLIGPMEAFKMADVVEPGPHYISVVLSHSGGAVSSTIGLEIATHAEVGGPLDTLIVVGGPGVHEISDADLEAVRRHSAVARRTASVCSGAFLLAAAGLLDGRRATTHWGKADRLAGEFPNVNVDSDRIYVKDGPIWSSAGVTAGIDLALALIEQDYGTDLSRSIAKSLVVHHRRKGGQSQYSEMLELDPQSDRIARTLVFVQEHMAEDLSVERLATVACLSPRQFTRAFHAQTGETPANAVERLRVEAAKARVELGIEPIEGIAKSVGFTDPERMRRAFVKRFSQSPSAMRKGAATEGRGRLSGLFGRVGIPSAKQAEANN